MNWLNKSPQSLSLAPSHKKKSMGNEWMKKKISIDIDSYNLLLGWEVYLKKENKVEKWIKFQRTLIDDSKMLININ